MAELTTIARPYAEAAFRMARDDNALPEWSTMLNLLAGLAADPRVAGALDNPKLTASDKASLVLSVAGDRLNAAGRNFVRVLVDADRFGVLPQIRTLFDALKNDTDGVSKARIDTAFPLTEAQEAGLGGQAVCLIGAAFAKQVMPKNETIAFQRDQDGLLHLLEIESQQDAVLFIRLLLFTQHRHYAILKFRGCFARTGREPLFEERIRLILVCHILLPAGQYQFVQTRRGAAFCRHQIVRGLFGEHLLDHRTFAIEQLFELSFPVFQLSLLLFVRLHDFSGRQRIFIEASAGEDT